MKLNLLKITTTLVLLLSAPLAHAVSCSITATSFATAYAPTGVIPNVTQGSFDVSCIKNLGALDINSVNYTVAVDNGANPTGTENNARLNGANNIQYETYRNSGCNIAWGSAPANSFNASNVTLPFTTTINYWGCITLAGQSVKAGNYSDNVNMTLSYNNNLGLTSTVTKKLSVQITNPAQCTFTSNIADVAFGNYVAFRNTPLTAPSSNIVLNCTKELPYSLSLDATNGVVVGLNYSLTLNVSSNRGTGLNQTHTISGTMPANQAGTCATGTCAGTDIRTLTITY